MCNNCMNGKCEGNCAGCAKGEILKLKENILDLQEQIKAKDLTIFFLEIDESFKTDFEKNANKLFFKAIQALEIGDMKLDHQFYCACSRIKEMYKGETDEKIRAFLLILESFELSYTKSKYRFYD